MALADQITHAVLRVHARLYEGSDGRIGHRLIGVPTLMLRTTGRRSGATRTNSLVYATDGNSYLVVPSAGGSDRAPGWLHNLRAEPSVEVQIARERKPATARVLERGDPEFDRLWKAVNDNNRGRYDVYQSGTERQIPVVVLTPEGT
jgi:deazaflavin-dependent oxidoreductase (nitroreductase family)